MRDWLVLLGYNIDITCKRENVQLNTPTFITKFKLKAHSSKCCSVTICKPNWIASKQISSVSAQLFAECVYIEWKRQTKIRDGHQSLRSNIIITFFFQIDGISQGPKVVDRFFFSSSPFPFGIVTWRRPSIGLKKSDPNDWRIRFFWHSRAYQELPTTIK